MKSNAPKFHAGKKALFYADSCLPLVEAASRGDLTLRAIGRNGYPGERIDDEVLPGLSSVGFWDARLPQKWGLPVHRNEGIEFTFLETGQMNIRIENKSMQLHFDELMITRPWQPHQLGDPFVSSGRLIWLILDVGVRRPHEKWRWPSWIILQPGDVAELERYLRQNEQYTWRASPDLGRCFRGLAEALQDASPEAALSPVTVWINALLLQVLGLFRSQEVILTESLTGTERSVEQFLAELREALDKPWTVESMAESCHLGVTRFVHYVRRLTNASPAEYLMASRMEQACTLLRRETGSAVAEVARRCGFSSSQYFTNVFRRRFGTTPDAYRRQGRRV